MKLGLILALMILFSPLMIGSLTSGTTYATYYGPEYQGALQGPLPSSSQVCVSVFIPPKNLNYLYLLVQEIGNHQIKPLNRSQLVSEFGNVKVEHEVESYLRSNGFTVVYSSPFSVMGVSNASQVEKLFRTSLFLYNFNGNVYYRPTSTPVIPSQLRDTIIMGLSNFTLIKPDLTVLGNLTSQGLRFGSPNYFGFQFSATYYTGREIQEAYNVTPGGKNVTVAVIDAYGDPELIQDLKAFDKQNGLPPINLTILPVGPYHPIFGPFSGWDTETALDVEAVHSMAPYAHVIAVIASNPGAALFEAVDLVVSEDLAQVVSMSWGLPENVIGASGFYAYFQGSTPNYPYLDYYFALGSAEGISFFAASGDNGAYGGTVTSHGGVNFPASSPFVTAVGGTSLYLNVTSGSLEDKNASSVYGYEAAWGVLPQYFEPGVTSVSSGGGPSTLFPAPWYQREYLNASTRETPDVSADANPYTGLVVFAEGVEQVIGGTSLATPLWAGVTADLDSQLNQSLGLVNPALYWIYSNSSLYGKAFHPIYVGTNGVYSAGKGYNMVTGLGSPNYPYLLNAIKTYLNHPTLKISVSTFSENTSYPWYAYNSSVKIVAYITNSTGFIAGEGNFTAYVYTTNGLLMTVPLHFNGTYWNGEFKVSPGQPANIWSIVVNGSSNGVPGIAQTDIDVGDSVVISQPVPFPYSTPLPPNEPIPIQVQVTAPNGTPLANQSVTAYLIKNHKPVLNVTLLPSGFQGIYNGQFSLLPNMPQGTYLLIVNTTDGSTYTYLYFGNAVYGTVYPTINSGYPGSSLGSNVTFFAETISSFGLGLFSSNVTAYIYHGKELVGQVPLISAPEAVQFGIFSLFGVKEANFTIPYNFTPGIYQVVYESVVNTSVGLEYGNYTTWFYVSPALNINISLPGNLYQGQNVFAKVRIEYQNGTPVTQGMFSLTLIPTGTSYSSLIEEADYEIPLQYNSNLGVWIGNFTVPSFNGNGQFRGSQPGVISGPWTGIVEGTSALGNPVFSTQELYVNPQTYVGTMTVSQGVSSPYVVLDGETYSLNQIYSPNLTVRGVSVTLTDDSLGTLNVIDSSVTISSSEIGHVNAVNSTVILTNSMIRGSQIAMNLLNSNVTLISSILNSSQYAFNISGGSVVLRGTTIISPILSSTPAPRVIALTGNVTSGFEILNVTLSPYAKPLSLSLNGQAQNFTYSKENNTLVLHVPFKAPLFPQELTSSS
ncbi:S53 family peptidase [Metallosphaera hakonensis]|uniref:S53 family peptidase n=1 Tax=Metallosphaera hakonensis TaxID=79601 RepID=UPI000AB5CDE1|nr:protease pro-enzyme activation domain-containing protein [Metallosphaera hakonensis]